MTEFELKCVFQVAVKVLRSASLSGGDDSNVNERLQQVRFSEEVSFTIFTFFVCVEVPAGGHNLAQATKPSKHCSSHWLDLDTQPFAHITLVQPRKLIQSLEVPL